MIRYFICYGCENECFQVVTGASIKPPERCSFKGDKKYFHLNKDNNPNWVSVSEENFNREVLKCQSKDV